MTRVQRLRKLLATGEPFILTHIANRQETALLIGANRTSVRLGPSKWRWT